MDTFLKTTKETATILVSNITRDRWFILVDDTAFHDTPEPRRMLLEQEKYRLPMAQLDEDSPIPARITARKPPTSPTGPRLIALDPEEDDDMLNMLTGLNYATVASARKLAAPGVKRRRLSESTSRITCDESPRPPAQENNDEEPCEFQQKLRQLGESSDRQPRKEKTNIEAVPTMSKLMTRIVKVGDAITREKERLDAGIPSSIIAPPPIRVLQKLHGRLIHRHKPDPNGHLKEDRHPHNQATIQNQKGTVAGVFDHGDRIQTNKNRF